jgi:hypothetical protein
MVDPMDAAPPSPLVRALRVLAGAISLLAAVISFTFAEGIHRGDGYMLIITVLNVLMLAGMTWFFHQRYRWWGGDLDLYALIALYGLLAALIIFNLTDSTMRGPAAPLYWLWMFGYALFSIDLALALLTGFPEPLGILRWYAYLQLVSGAGIASMMFLPWAGHIAEAADLVFALILFRAALDRDRPQVDDGERRYAPAGEAVLPT